MGEALALRETGHGIVNFDETAMSADSVLKQVELIQTVMKKVMKDDQHYGVIPGTEKPSLLKPGAEKLGLTFRLAPEYEVEVKELPRDHREYRVKCRLFHIPTGAMVGEGVGTCSTMESKWRYVSDLEFTGKPVPKEYWDHNRDVALIGGKGHVAKKNAEGKWEIAKISGKVERDNPADCYNTCEKMGKKRAHVDAILTATAASDIFTQDVEEMLDNEAGGGRPSNSTKTDTPAESSAPKDVETLRKEIWSMLTDMEGGKAADKLEELTTWVDKKKNPPETVKGFRDIAKMKHEKNVQITHGKVKKLHDEWRKTHPDAASDWCCKDVEKCDYIVFEDGNPVCTHEKGQGPCKHI